MNEMTKTDPYGENSVNPIGIYHTLMHHNRV